MKILAIVLTAAALIAIAAALRLRSQTPQPQSRPTAEIYLSLRKQALSSSREKLGIPPTPTPTTPWGVVMDWGVANGTATVLALSDGSASIYFSGGGGQIGGQSKEAINKAAKRAVELATACQSDAKLSEDFPLPQTHQVIFHLLTDQGVFSVARSEQELQSGAVPLVQLGNAMQEIITQYRLIQSDH